MSEWIKHDGKGMPVDGDTRVDVRWADEERPDALGYLASLFDTAPFEWVDDPEDETGFRRITHYRIIDNKED